MNNKHNKPWLLATLLLSLGFWFYVNGGEQAYSIDSLH